MKGDEKKMRASTQKQREAGFTLVEIAIVLVIIGLLLGGILKGQEMIVQAKIKNSISDFNGVLAAYNGYLDRYRALPGDDVQASRWTGGTVGNGNSVIQGTYESQTADAESRLFWQHMRLAGFIPGQGQQQPTNAHNGIIGVQTGDAAGGATLAAAAAAPDPAVPGIGGVMICASQIPDKVAIAIDNQADDGRSRSGQIRSVAITGNGAIGAGQAPDATYQETGTTTYVVCRSL
jgi:prepilin-type N-terminal cleavage/methylation domain-containing protein